jgi:hypothetical protein
MATLALAVAGAAAGSALLPTGLTVLGATITGATIGSQIGALAGSFLDQALFAPSGQTRSYEGPRLSELRVTASTEGAPIPRLYGRARLSGQVIWATDFEEDVVTTTESGGSGKGTRRASASATTRRTEYRYFANFAVALAEGPISGLQRVWADGRELDLSGVTYRLYLGTEDQEPDALILAREGADNAPAYRGLAYIVFERLALADFGNRLPQLSFEVHRAVDVLDQLVRAVVVIPGSGEFVYDTDPVTRLGNGGERVYENVHTRQGGTDWRVGVDQLEQALPNARNVSLIVSWFGTDLRAGHCEIEPGIEIAAKDTYPNAWSVAGVSRADAHLVSTHDGRPGYGGTPSDRSVLAAIADLKARGIGVMLTPFVLMDIPQDNSLPDPWTGAASQPAYPWRGRITCDPAPGQPGTPDKTAVAATQIASLVGTAAVNDFAIVDGAVVYSGPDEWTLRRQVLHYAWLAQLAGGVDAFCIGSELKALTSVRDGAASYPFVAALVAFAADVKAVLPDAKVTYAADWSDYFGHQPQDGTGDVFFHLDPLWASPDIDAIGVDLYWPLADWRSDPGHLDAAAGARSPYDLDYLKSNLAGGEGYDWYYASDADREPQVRTPITDGAGRPWVFRYKDTVSWWSNAHYDRPGGVEASTPTAWIPQSKPIWLTEVGCPAVDKGANQPNAFVDPKSAESTLPFFSDGRRDDLAQRRYLQAILEALDPDHPASIPGLNPASTEYAGTMIDPTHIHVYAWDARPYPAFPLDTTTWGDGQSWRLGHWLNGRIASAPLSDVIARMLGDYAFDRYEASTIGGVVPGYAIDRIMSAREALQPLELAYFFDTLETEGRIVFRARGADGPVALLGDDDLVERSRRASLLTITRTEESELPLAAKIAYVAATQDYRPAIAEARRLTGAAGRVAQADLPVVLDGEDAAAIAETFLFEAWAARERASFVLPPSRIAVEPGDVVTLTVGGRERSFRVREVGEQASARSRR